MVAKGHPLGGLSRMLVVMLVLAAIGLNRQNNQVPFFPIDFFSVYGRVPFAVEDKQLDAALVPVPAGMDFDVVDEAGPVPGGRLGLSMPGKIPSRQTLPALTPRKVGSFDDDLAF